MKGHNAPGRGGTAVLRGKRVGNGARTNDGGRIPETRGRVGVGSWKLKEFCLRFFITGIAKYFTAWISAKYWAQICQMVCCNSTSYRWNPRDRERGRGQRY